MVDCGTLGELEITVSANVTKLNDNIEAKNIAATIFIPENSSGNGKHCLITHLLSESVIETFTETIMAKYIERRARIDSAAISGPTSIYA